MQRFRHNKREYELEIKYNHAILTFPEKYGIHLTKLLGNMDLTNETLSAILLDDEKLIDLMWFYVKAQTDSLEYEVFLETLVPNDLVSFRESFWEETLTFSGPLKEQSLKEMWKTFRKELKNMKFDELDSKSPPEESTHRPILSEN
jgi:hypothetical protein